MKRGKIMLAAFGVIAVVGSMLAFKANERVNGNLRCSPFTASETTTATMAATFCTSFNFTTVVEADGNIRFCTLKSNPSLPCRATTYVTAAE